MWLVFTILCVTNQAKDLTLKGTWDFQTKLVEKEGIESERWDKTKKKNLTINNPKEDKDHALAFETDGVKARENMGFSSSSISKSERLRRKLKFQEKGKVNPRIKEMGRFLTMTILNSLRNWEPKGWSSHHKSSHKRILSSSPTTNRVYLIKSWKTCAIAFQGQWCDHLTIVLASHPLVCVSCMLRMT